MKNFCCMLLSPHQHTFEREKINLRYFVIRFSQKSIFIENFPLSFYFTCYSYEQESKTQFVVDAVYAFAYALHNLHNDLCVKGRAKDEQEIYRQAGVCREMVNFDGFEFYKNYLLNVSFIGKCSIFLCFAQFS